MSGETRYTYQKTVTTYVIAKNGSAIVATLGATVTGGNVTGPASAVDGNLAAFNGTSGRIIKDGLVTPAQVIANTAKETNATHTGDVTGATALTIAPNAVTNAKAADMATSTIKGRATAGTGDPEDLTAAQVLTVVNVEAGADVTDAANVGAAIGGTAEDATPADADKFAQTDGTTLAHTTWGTIKSLIQAALAAVYAPIAKGVTNGDSHDHSGGDGAQIDHGGLAGLGDDDHPQYADAPAVKAHGTITDGNSVSPDWADGHVHTFTCAAAATIGVNLPTNMPVGATIGFVVTNGGAAAALNLNAGYKHASGTAPSWTAAGSDAVFYCQYGAGTLVGGEGKLDFS